MANKEFRLSDHYRPLPKQKLYHESSAKYKCYMGGVGSGKTTALIWECLLLSLEFPGNYGLMGRYTYPELRDTTMFEFFQICPDEVIEDFKKTENKLIFKNGSVIIFRHLEDPDKIKSLNLGWFAIDEMTEVPENVFLMLQSRLRRTNVPRRVGFGSTNPEGHDWIWHKWCVQHRNDPNYLFIQAPTTENPYLPDDYVDDLVSSYPEHWVKRYIYGDPAAFAGQIITTWDKDQHIIEPFDPPDSWQPRTIVLDHGTNNPTAVIWCAVHPEGFHIIYKEHYAASQTVDWHARKILEINDVDSPEFLLADPAIFNLTLQNPKRGMHSVADLYADYDLHFVPADNDVKSGIQMLLNNFKIDKDLINPFTQKKGSPRIFITADCENIIHEVPQYRWKDVRVRGRFKNKPEEPEKANDHTVDCIRYYLMTKSRPYKRIKRMLPGFKHPDERKWDMLERRNKRSKQLAGKQWFTKFDEIEAEKLQFLEQMKRKRNEQTNRR